MSSAPAPCSLAASKIGIARRMKKNNLAHIISIQSFQTIDDAHARHRNGGRDAGDNSERGRDEGGLAHDFWRDLEGDKDVARHSRNAAEGIKAIGTANPAEGAQHRQSETLRENETDRKSTRLNSSH